MLTRNKIDAYPDSDYFKPIDEMVNKEGDPVLVVGSYVDVYHEDYSKEMDNWMDKAARQLRADGYNGAIFIDYRH